MRIDRHEMMIKMAEITAQRGTCDRLQVGAVIARDGRSISTGYNGNVSGQAHCRHHADKLKLPCVTAMHAEANALLYAARNGVSTNHADLYTTHEPCFDCARLIVNAGIARVFFKIEYRKHDGVNLLIDLGYDVLKFNEEYSLIQVRKSN